jgi:hypothetical protein
VKEMALVRKWLNFDPVLIKNGTKLHSIVRGSIHKCLKYCKELAQRSCLMIGI